MTNHEAKILREVVGLNPDTITLDWDCDISWHLLDYGEMVSEDLWCRYCYDVEHDAGEMDDLTHKRKVKELERRYDEYVEWMRSEIWASLGYTTTTEEKDD